MKKGKLVFSLQASGLHGRWNKSNPYLEIRRTYDGEDYDGKVGEREWPIYRGKHTKISPNPMFESVSVDINALCDGDLYRRINIVLYDYNGEWKEIGSFDTTVNELVKNSVGEEIMLEGEKTKKIIVDACKIDGAADSIPGAPAAGVDDAPDKKPKQEEIVNKDEHDVIDPDKKNNDNDEASSNDRNLTKENVDKETKPPSKCWFDRIKEISTWGKGFPFLNDIIGSFESKVKELTKRKFITNGADENHVNMKRCAVIIPAIATFLGVIIRRKKNNDRSWGGDSDFSKMGLLNDWILK